MIFVSLWLTTQLFNTPKLPSVSLAMPFHQTGTLSSIPPSTNLSKDDLQPFTLKRIRPFPRIEESPEWNGHLSAQNFKTPQEQQQLHSIEASLKRALKNSLFDHTQALKNLEIKNEENRSRGMANAQKLILHTGTIETEKELIAVFIHELGHIVDIGMVKGRNKIPSQFKDGNASIYTDDKSLIFYQISWQHSYQRKKDAERKDFVSGYAMTDVFEDFAESYLFYRLHGEKFRYSMKYSPDLRKKYDYLKTHVFRGQEFQINKPVENFAKEVIWDATLLDYDLANLEKR